MLNRTVISRCLALALIALGITSWPQQLWAAEEETEDDLGVVVCVSADHKLAKGLKLELEAEMRTQDGMQQFERWSFGAGIDYKIVSDFKVHAGYVLMDRYHRSELTSKGNLLSGYWAPRHRWYAGLSETLQLGRWKVGIRERYQLTHSPLQYVPKRIGTHCDCTVDHYGTRLTDEKKAGSQEHLLRSRLLLAYNIRHSKLTPSVSVEALNDLTAAFDVDQIRYSVALDYKLGKHSGCALEWRYKDRSGSDEGNGHLITFGYHFSF